MKQEKFDDDVDRILEDIRQIPRNENDGENDDDINATIKIPDTEEEFSQSITNL